MPGCTVSGEPGCLCRLLVWAVENGNCCSDNFSRCKSNVKSKASTAPAVEALTASLSMPICISVFEIFSSGSSSKCGKRASKVYSRWSSKFGVMMLLSASGNGTGPLSQCVSYLPGS